MTHYLITTKQQALQQRIGQAQQIKSECERLKQQSLELKRDLRVSEQAQSIIQRVAKLTQEQLQYRISELVSLALSSVFAEPYKFEIEFVEKRGKTECELWFVKDGQRIHPLSASGGGVVNIASMALRIALWKLSTNKTDNVIILDEPTSYLSDDLQIRAFSLIKELSKELDLQIIMITQYQNGIEFADKSFKVKKVKGVSICSN